MAVRRVTDDRQVRRRKVDANLVCPSGDEAAPQEGQAESEPLVLELVERSRRANPGRQVVGRRPEGFHLLPVPRIAPDREGDLALADLRHSGDEGEVLLLHGALADLAREQLVRPVGLCHEEHARRVAVEPVHDPRPALAPDAREVPDVVEQRVDEGSGRVAGRGMDHEAGRLVDGDQVFVLVEDRERNVLGLEHALARLGHLDRDLLARAHDVRALGGLAADARRALGDELLDARAREVRARRDEEQVEPRARGRGPDLEAPEHGVLRLGAASAREVDEHPDGQRREQDPDELRRREDVGDHEPAHEVAAPDLDDPAGDRVEQHVEPEHLAVERLAAVRPLEDQEDQKGAGREIELRRMQRDAERRADRVVGKLVGERHRERPMALLAVAAAGREAAPTADGLAERDRRRAHVGDRPRGQVVPPHVDDGRRRGRDQAAVEDAARAQDLDEVLRVGGVALPLDGDEEGLGPEDRRGEDVERQVEDLLVRQAGREGLAAQQPDPREIGDREDDAV